MVAKRFFFRRPSLAESIARDLAGEGLSDYSSGMFLAAPRRTGKSTFMKLDLVPECERRGWFPLYVDLWEESENDPGDLIAGAIAQALVPFESRLRTLAKSLGINKLNVLRTVSWDFTQPKLPEGASLTQALELLHQATGKLVVFIIDEAQHALKTEKGISAMFGLKAARDALNLGREPEGLRLVFTGSSRDKLANLVLSRSQPFFGASITPFPLLGRDFIEAYTANVNSKLAPGNQFAPADIEEAFRLVGNRPERLSEIIKDVSVDFGAANDLGDLLRSGALAHQAGVWREYESSYMILTPPQQAVLEVMAENLLANQSFAPYAETTVLAVTRVLEKNGHDSLATTTTIQNALNALRERDLVWKSNRGEYALDDSAMAAWLTRKQ
ncbi:hypothetical protein [Marinobacter sp.]|uniref:hypothetical protein n=1 Tax=Marinobacter sp. TaxID=50741 RepID=UPI003A8D4FDC